MNNPFTGGVKKVTSRGAARTGGGGEYVPSTFIGDVKRYDPEEKIIYVANRNDKNYNPNDQSEEKLLKVRIESSLKSFDDFYCETDYYNNQFEKGDSNKKAKMDNTFVEPDGSIKFDQVVKNGDVYVAGYAEPISRYLGDKIVMASALLSLKEPAIYNYSSPEDVKRNPSNPPKRTLMGDALKEAVSKDPSLYKDIIIEGHSISKNRAVDATGNFEAVFKNELDTLKKGLPGGQASIAIRVFESDPETGKMKPFAVMIKDSMLKKGDTPAIDRKTGKPMTTRDGEVIMTKVPYTTDEVYEALLKTDVVSPTGDMLAYESAEVFEGVTGRKPTADDYSEFRNSDGNTARELRIKMAHVISVIDKGTLKAEVIPAARIQPSPYILSKGKFEFFAQPGTKEARRAPLSNESPLDRYTTERPKGGSGSPIRVVNFNGAAVPASESSIRLLVDKFYTPMGKTYKNDPTKSNVQDFASVKTDVSAKFEREFEKLLEAKTEEQAMSVPQSSAEQDLEEDFDFGSDDDDFGDSQVASQRSSSKGPSGM